MTVARVGLVGYGRIGRYLAERIGATDDATVAFVCRSTSSDDTGLDVPVFAPDADAVPWHSADLVVEAATFRAVEDLVPVALRATDVLVLSTAALADEELLEIVERACVDGGTSLYVPHGAVLGTDGLQDARRVLDEVRIETRKHPENLDFSYAADSHPSDIDGETVLYDGPTRAVCREFPRNVNSHATVALAGLGFDETRSTLIADPDVTTASHHIVARGDGTTLGVDRETEIDGVTGEYTLVSILGTVRRILADEPGIAVL